MAYRGLYLFTLGRGGGQICIGENSKGARLLADERFMS
jgi:hypothetical protein